MFPYRQCDEVYHAVEGALNHKWRGAARAVAYEELDVAAGATFRQTDADVSVAALSGSGHVASPITLAANGSIKVFLTGEKTVAPISCEALTLAANGTLSIDADWKSFSGLDQEIEVKVIDCANITGSVQGWKAVSTDGKKSVCSREFTVRPDGLYVKLHGPYGMLLIVR